MNFLVLSEEIDVSSQDRAKRGPFLLDESDHGELFSFPSIVDEDGACEFGGLFRSGGLGEGAHSRQGAHSGTVRHLQ